MDQWTQKEKIAMKALDKCPVCAGKLVRKKVEKLLRGGQNTAVVTAEVDICLHCGECIYSQKTVRHFEEIRTKLERRQTSEFQVLGKLFQA